MSTKDPVTNKGDQSLAEVGDNSEREHDIFDGALRQQIKMNAERDEMNARHRKARKVFKADGVVLGKLDETVRKLAWTPAEYREDVAIQYRYDRWAGLAVGEQPDLFDGLDDEELAREDWKARGRADALRLLPAEIPKGCPPENHNDYLAGHEEARWPK